jgi:flagellar basal body-associated protein FliL
MHKIIPIIVALVAGLLAFVWFMNTKNKKKEKWFSRDLNYGKMNSKIWNATVAKGLKGIANENSEIREMYPYLGYGTYTGFLCKGPNNQGCTAYANYIR